MGLYNIPTKCTYSYQQKGPPKPLTTRIEAYSYRAQKTAINEFTESIFDY